MVGASKDTGALATLPSGITSRVMPDVCCHQDDEDGSVALPNRRPLEEEVEVDGGGGGQEREHIQLEGEQRLVTRCNRRQRAGCCKRKSSVGDLERGSEEEEGTREGAVVVVGVGVGSVFFSTTVRRINRPVWMRLASCHSASVANET